MDKIRNEDIWWRVNMQPAEQTENKNKIRWWSRVKRMAPTAPQSKALQPERRRPRGRPRSRWEAVVPRWYNEMGIPMTDPNNWVKERRPIVYPLDADGRRVRLKQNRVNHSCVVYQTYTFIMRDIFSIEFHQRYLGEPPPHCRSTSSICRWAGPGMDLPITESPDCARRQIE